MPRSLLSLTFICAKIMEQIIAISFNYGPPKSEQYAQHGFRSNHSCVMQLITLTEDISFALDNHKQTDIILLDFSKAFDTVPHQRLLTKLR